MTLFNLLLIYSGWRQKLTHATDCVWKSEGNLQESILSFPFCGSQELNSGDNAWQQSALPTGI